MAENQNTVKIIDGGLGTELERLGYHIDDYALWSARWLVTDPSVIAKVHMGFLEKGADIIETASYQTSIHNLCENVGVSVEKAKQIIKSSVQVAKQARNEFWSQKNAPLNIDSPVYRDRTIPEIAGSVGPYGACLNDGSEYTGDYVQNSSIEELMDWHRPRLKCLVESDVDYIAFETIPALKEGMALVKLLREFPNTKAWLSFSCQDGSKTCYGDSLASAMRTCVLKAPIDQLIAVGVNCVSPEYVTDLLLSSQASNGDIPFVVYPNSGEKWVSGQGWQEPETKSTTSLDTLVPTWIKLGVKFIGGCCRTTPDDIARIRQIVKEKKILTNE